MCSLRDLLCTSETSSFDALPARKRNFRGRNVCKRKNWIRRRPYPARSVVSGDAARDFGAAGGNRNRKNDHAENGRGIAAPFAGELRVVSAGRVVHERERMADVPAEGRVCVRRGR